jgi:hypothetical protein
MAPKRSIPRGQVIYPYGVGAILDWGQECFVVLDTSSPGWASAPRVSLPRLQQRLGARDGFRLPPVLKDDAPSRPLSVQRFPSWLFCPRCRRMWRWGRDQEVASKGNSPRCLTHGCRAVLVPMRYVAVCNGGHIAEVDWYRWAHRRAEAAGPCSPLTAALYFEAAANKGATLDALGIKCRSCGSGHSLKDVLNTNALKAVGQKCWARQPWQRKDDEAQCDGEIRVLQRSQTAVHYADIVSALDLTTDVAAPERDLDKVLPDVLGSLGIRDLEDAQPFLKAIVRQASTKLRRDIPDDEVQKWLASRFTPPSAGLAAPAQFSEAELLAEEWPALTTPTPSTRRAPLVVTTDSGVAALDPSLRELLENVYLVERLRELRAFRGFRRVAPDAKLVPPDLVGRQSWLPAIEVFGEGVFLQFSTAAVERWESSQAKRLGERLHRLRESLTRGEGPLARFKHLESISARFIMVHTFAHILMRQLCYESGYGGASVRERLYAFEDKIGVLIYTADGDSEGALGGLVRQGRNDRLGRTIAAALERATWCSNDPICRELPEHGLGKLTLAACHACALVPETSCSHLNTLLDRELVVGDGTKVEGFFSAYLAYAQSRSDQ